MTLYRSKKAGLDKSAYEEMVVEGGTVAKQTLLKVWDVSDNNKVVELVGGGDTYKKFVNVLLAGYEAGSLAKAEEFANAQKHQLLTQNPDTLTIAPLIAYFKNKTDEIDKIRFAFIGIKNDVDKETIKERLK
jgi:vacuolar-type H+-ATPase subunit C/Vma6